MTTTNELHDMHVSRWLNIYQKDLISKVLIPPNWFQILEVSRAIAQKDICVLLSLFIVIKREVPVLLLTFIIVRHFISYIYFVLSIKTLHT